MRFLFFAAQYLPTIGGVERYTCNLAKTLIGLGHEAAVVTSALPGLPLRETTVEGIFIYRLPSHLFLRGRFPSLRHNTAFRHISKELWAQSYDFALINTRFYPLSLWATHQCKKYHLPALLLDHSTGHLSLGSPLPDLAGRIYEHAAMWYLKPRVPFYGVSNACGEWLRHFGVTAQGTLYNAVNPAALVSIAHNPPCDFRARFSLPADAPLLAFSGRFIREKGIYELLDAFAVLRADIPTATLIMAGDGPEREDIFSKKDPGVICPGNLTHEENIALLAQADVFCLPTRYAEGLPTALLEAAAVDTFIVATPAGGTPELIENEKSGILLKDANPAALAGALRRVLVDKAFRTKAQQQAKQKVQTTFTWNATAHQLIQIAEKESRT